MKWNKLKCRLIELLESIGDGFDGGPLITPEERKILEQMKKDEAQKRRVGRMIIGYNSMGKGKESMKRCKLDPISMRCKKRGECPYRSKRGSLR